MSVHQCPRCELRFPDTPELRDHLLSDHAHHEVVDIVVQDIVATSGTPDASHRHVPNPLAGGNADD